MTPHPPLPLTKDLVLIGGGHTHALVLRRWGMKPLPGVRVTVINPGPSAPYSGMLPGFVAGHYPREALDIDLVKLARFAGARIIPGAAIDIDLRNRTIRVAGRPPIAYDVCSVDIGITSDMPDLPGFAENAIPAKPLGPFAERWASFRDRKGPASVAVLGAGVAGAELAMAMAHYLRAHGRMATVTLIERQRALTAIGEKSQARIRKALEKQGVTLLEHTHVISVEPDRVFLSDGDTVAAQFTTGAAGARAHDWLGATGLELQSGYIAVDRRLQSSDPHVFAVGDCAQFVDDPRPKAGVYAVRQAPVLFDNLCAVLSGAAMRDYRPQKDYLKLISLGGKSALGERSGVPLEGHLMWRWKDQIDRSFMAKFRNLPAMDGPEVPPLHADGVPEAMGERPMCGGCGAKIGRAALRSGLTPAIAPIRDDVVPLPGDDAALLITGGARQVITTDHLRAITHDPVLMARIAANHALGDIWAMGATPQAATSTVILPRLSAELQERTLAEITTAAGDVFREAGADIVGGHSSVGNELTIGFTITGLCDHDPITLAGARPGDMLILTKPLGIGVLMAAEMGSRAHGDWIMAAWEHMTRSQEQAAQILSRAHAMTDVTGFGLAGHLLGICEASGVGAVLDLGAIPYLDGAVELSDQGWASSLYDQNAALAPELAGRKGTALLFDPQTAGGLLAAVAPEMSDDILRALWDAGYTPARIGTLTDGPVQLSLLTG